MYRLQVKDHFDAAHYIKDYVGKCSRMHGHRWDVELSIEGEKLDRLNMLVDFGEIKDLLRGLEENKLDHYILNVELNEDHVTAEYLAGWVYGRLASQIGDLGVKLVRVCIWESSDCCVKYSPTMHATGQIQRPVLDG
jgi:6-pyruvoyltetrahydropterin/6-carboxytetrahydropterin synthase